MSQESKQEADEMRAEYDISGGERGRYYDRYQTRTITSPSRSASSEERADATSPSRRTTWRVTDTP